VSLAPIELAGVPAIDASPSITSPAQSVVLDRAAAPVTPVKVSAGGWLTGHGDRRLAVVLDSYRVRYASVGSSLELGDLVPADRALEPGPHRLLVALVDEQGLLVKRTENGLPPFASVRFGVETPPGPDAEPPEIVYVEPQGTYNGEGAADAVRLDFYLLGVMPGASHPRIEVRLNGLPPESGSILSDWRAFAFSRLESGDHTVELALSDASSASRAVRRTITVNRDVSVE
jgi:hypothetical protein